MVKERLVILFALMILLLPAVAFADTLEPALQVSMSQNPSTIVPGNEGYIQITIANVGTASASSVEIDLVSLDSPLVSKTTFSAGGLGGVDIGKSISTTFRFSVPAGTTSGFYTAVFSVKWCTSNVCKESVQSTVIAVQTPSALQIASVSPTDFKIGKNATLTFTLLNVGQSSLNNVVLSWQSSNDVILPLGVGNEIFIQSMGAGERKSFSTSSIVSQSATPGVYTLAIKMTYDDPSGTKQAVNATVGLTISGYVEFVATIDSTKNLYYGRVGTATISFANTGTVAADYLTVNARSDFGSKEVYLGKLDPDDSDTVELVQDLTKAKQPYTAYLNLSYKDSYGNVYSIQRTLQLTPTTAPLELPTMWILVLIVVAIGGVWWVKRRKK